LTITATKIQDKLDKSILKNAGKEIDIYPAGEAFQILFLKRYVIWLVNHATEVVEGDHCFVVCSAGKDGKIFSKVGELLSFVQSRLLYGKP
jgi:hypothetical protein